MLPAEWLPVERERFVEDYRNLVNEHDLAGELQVSIWTLRSWRRRAYGPTALKMGKRVMYRRTDVSSFLVALDPVQ